MTRTLPLAALLLLATGCAKITPAEGDMQNVTIDPRVLVNEVPAADPPILAEAAKVIPVPYQGRWGMVEADCTSENGDNKGLLTIDETGLAFYESRATLKEQRPSEAGFAGLFAFTGEGQEWEKEIGFVRDGDKLTRTEDGQTTSYALCT